MDTTARLWSGPEAEPYTPAQEPDWLVLCVAAGCALPVLLHSHLYSAGGVQRRNTAHPPSCLCRFLLKRTGARARQWGSLASGLFASVALCALGTRTSSRFVLALVGAWLGYAGSVFFEMEFWFVAWAAVVTYLAYYLGEITRLGGAGRLGMIAFFVGAAPPSPVC